MCIRGAWTHPRTETESAHSLPGDRRSVISPQCLKAWDEWQLLFLYAEYLLYLCLHASVLPEDPGNLSQHLTAYIPKTTYNSFKGMLCVVEVHVMPNCKCLIWWLVEDTQGQEVTWNETRSDYQNKTGGNQTRMPHPKPEQKENVTITQHRRRHVVTVAQGRI